MSSQPLLPNEFRSAISEPRYLDDVPEHFAKELETALSQRHADIMAIQGDAYAPPLSTVLFLYRRNPGEYRKLVLTALPVPTTGAFRQHVAAAARDAWNADDWVLLGKLAYRFELGQACCRAPAWDQILLKDGLSEQVSDRSDPAAGLKTAFLKAFDFEHGALPAKGYVYAALAYWSLIPLHFVVPPQCFRSQPSVVGDWALLSAFCFRHAPWQHVPGSVDAAMKLQHPMLAVIVKKFKDRQVSKLPREHRGKNPFASQAGTLAIEPRKKRSRKSGFRNVFQHFRGSDRNAETSDADASSNQS